MKHLKPGKQLMLLATLLGAALLAEAAVLYSIETASTRLGIGLLLMALIMWVAGKVGVVSRIQQTLSRGFKRRSYLELRGLVDQMLTDVRRLNWLAAGAERGFQTRSAANKEIDAIEQRLHRLIGQIRQVAGKASPEAEPIELKDQAAA